MDDREYEWLNREVERWKTEAMQAKRAYEKSEITWRVREAAQRSGVVETALEDVTSRAVQEWKLDSKDRPYRLVDGGPDMDLDGGYVSFDKWLVDQRTASPHWFSTQSAASAGVPAASVPIRQGMPVGNNPWAKETYNLTEQGKIYRQSPQLAEQMATAAGAELQVDTGRRRW